MPKSEVARRARADEEKSRELSNAIEGRIAEMCRDLAVEAKRIRRLQEQADELRMVVREWVGETGPVLGPCTD